MYFEEAKTVYEKMTDQQALAVIMEFRGDKFWDSFSEKIKEMQPQEQKEFAEIVEKISDSQEGEQSNFRNCPQHCSYREVISARGDSINSLQKNWFNKWQYSCYSGKTIFEIANMLLTMHRPETKKIYHDLLAVPVRAIKRKSLALG